jgi:poly(3-hydroxybutyrate) depolymerase
MVISPLAVIFLKHKLEKKSVPDMVTDALKVSELVTNKIDDIREDYKADRVWVTQFHNGGHFYPTGKSITKFSVIYETVDMGVSSIQHNSRYGGFFDTTQLPKYTSKSVF